MSAARICCYTCITGGYDWLYVPSFETPGVDYICFTDRPEEIKTRIWRVRPIPDELRNVSAVKQQRVVKICPHRYLPEYDISVWVDGNIVVKGDLNKFVSEYDLAETPLYVRIHPSRDCVYEEAEAILKYGKDSIASINDVVNRYRSEGYPEHVGMAETCVLLRRHNDMRCRLFDEAWAAEVLEHSHRDQMSFNYVARKRGFLYGCLVNQFKIDGEYFKMKKHA